MELVKEVVSGVKPNELFDSETEMENKNDLNHGVGMNEFDFDEDFFETQNNGGSGSATNGPKKVWTMISITCLKASPRKNSFHFKKKTHHLDSAGRNRNPT